LHVSTHGHAEGVLPLLGGREGAGGLGRGGRRGALPPLRVHGPPDLGQHRLQPRAAMLAIGDGKPRRFLPVAKRHRGEQRNSAMGVMVGNSGTRRWEKVSTAAWTERRVLKQCLICNLAWWVVQVGPCVSRLCSFKDEEPSVGLDMVDGTGSVRCKICRLKRKCNILPLNFWGRREVGGGVGGDQGGGLGEIRGGGGLGGVQGGGAVQSSDTRRRGGRHRLAKCS